MTTTESVTMTTTESVTMTTTESVTMTTTEMKVCWWGWLGGIERCKNTQCVLWGVINPTAPMRANFVSVFILLFELAMSLFKFQLEIIKNRQKYLIKIYPKRRLFFLSFFLSLFLSFFLSFFLSSYSVAKCNKMFGLFGSQITELTLTRLLVFVTI